MRNICYFFVLCWLHSTIQSKQSLFVQSSTMKKNNVGRWSDIEHSRFLAALVVHGKNWQRVQKCVVTRTTVQCRTHAQKYFLRMKRFAKHNYTNFQRPIKLDERDRGAVYNLLQLRELHN